jgi:hypothetical protein
MGSTGGERPGVKSGSEGTDIWAVDRSEQSFILLAESGPPPEVARLRGAGSAHGYGGDRWRSVEVDSDDVPGIADRSTPRDKRFNASAFPSSADDGRPRGAFGGSTLYRTAGAFRTKRDRRSIYRGDRSERPLCSSRSPLPARSPFPPLASRSTLCSRVHSGRPAGGSLFEGIRQAVCSRFEGGWFGTSV